MTWSFLLEQCLARYVQVAGGNIRFKEVKTPSRPEDPQNKSPFRNPTDRGGDVCPWCQYTQEGPRTKEQEVKGKDEKGALAGVAASVLMKCMYAARMARFDLLWPVQGLARYISKLTKRQDEELYHLMCYIYTTRSWKAMG